MNPMDDPKLRISQQVAAIKAWERSQMNFDPVEIERQRAMPERIWAGTGPLEGEWYFQDGVLYGSTEYVRADLYAAAVKGLTERIDRLQQDIGAHWDAILSHSP